MTWHDSDLPLKEKFNLLRIKEIELESQLRKIKQFQVDISSLKLIFKQETIVDVKLQSTPLYKCRLMMKTIFHE